MTNDDSSCTDSALGKKGLDSVEPICLAQDSNVMWYQQASMGETLYNLLADDSILYDREGCILSIGETIGALLAVGLPSHASTPDKACAISFLVRDERGCTLPDEVGPVRRILHGWTVGLRDAVEVYATRSDGCEIRLSLYGAPLRDRHGELAGAIVVVRENVRFDENSALLLPDEIRNASLRPESPLHAYRATISEVSDGPREAEIQLYSAETPRSGGALEMLEQERTQAVTTDFDPVWLDLNGLIIDVMARLLPTVLHHQLRWQLARALPLLWGDRSRLTQVFCFLLNNAIRYSPVGGEIYITTAREGQIVHISVRDQGASSAVSELEHLLQCYSREATDLPRDRMLDGGLPLACTIIHMHGGQAWVESSPHRGFIFHFTLPFPNVAE